MKSISKVDPGVRLIRAGILAATSVALLAGLSHATSHNASAKPPLLLELSGDPGMQYDGTPTSFNFNHVPRRTSLQASVMWGSLVNGNDANCPRSGGGASCGLRMG